MHCLSLKVTEKIDLKFFFPLNISETVAARRVNLKAFGSRRQPAKHLWAAWQLSQWLHRKSTQKKLPAASEALWGIMTESRKTLPHLASAESVGGNRVKFPFATARGLRLQPRTGGVRISFSIIIHLDFLASRLVRIVDASKARCPLDDDICFSWFGGCGSSGCWNILGVKILWIFEFRYLEFAEFNFS